MAPNPDLFIDLDPSEAGTEVVKTVVLPWSGQSTPLRIPAGLSDGAILMLPGIGPATVPGGPSRDAYVQVRIVPGGGGTVPASFGAAPFGTPGPVPPVSSAPPTTPFGAPPVSAPPTSPFGAGPPVSAPPTAPYGTPPVSAPPTTPFGAGPPVSAPPTAPYGTPPVSGPPTGPYGTPPVSGPPTGPYGTPPVSGPPTTPFGAGPPGPPYGPPPQFGAFPPPPAKSGRGKVIAIVGGAVAVVLLVALAVPLLIWAGSRDDGPPSNGTASGPGGEPSPSAAPVSAQEYQALLAEVDKAVAPGFTQLGAAKNPKAVGTAAGTIERALDQQLTALSKVVPPQNAAAAHADLLRGLEGMIDSVTETGSAAGAGEVCLGSSALARLSRDTAADDIRTAQQALAAADPAQPYQVGKFVPKKTADGNRRLSNGAYIKRVRSGQGQLKIENGGSSDAVINLVLGSAKTPTVSVYVRAKGKHTVSSVKDGTYRIYMTGGKDWDARAKAFSRNCNFQRFEDTFKFTTTSSQYTIWTITLTPVAGGNAQTSEVDPNAFPGG